MTRLLTRTGHQAVHGLAMRTGCRCPDCGTGPRTARAVAFDDLFDEDAWDEGDDDFDEDAFLADLFNEDADYARRRQPARRPAARAPARPQRRAPAARPAARPRPAAPRRPPSRLPAAVGPARRPPPRGQRPLRPYRRHPTLTPGERRSDTSWLRSRGWTGWRQGARGRPVSVQDLVNFAAAGGVRQLPGAANRRPNQERLTVTPEGRRMLQNDPRYRRLAPMFSGQDRQRLYHIAEPGTAPDHRSHYVGQTVKTPGIRVLEHLRFPEPGQVHRRLVDAARAGTLNQLHVQRGRVRDDSNVGPTHTVENMLQRHQRADWNNPRGLGFAAESLELEW